MTFVIGSACIDITDRSCLQECPVDCIYEGDRKLYINPDECIDCGACEPACPVQAIAPAEELQSEEQIHASDAEAFFHEPLPGRSEPIGSPGGARRYGRLGIDTPLVTAIANGSSAAGTTSQKEGS